MEVETIVTEENDFNPENLRISQDFDELVNLKKALLTIPVRKPDRQWFFRVHPDSAYSLQTAVLELKDDRETYLVEQPLWQELAGEVVVKVIHTAINRHGNVFLWPIRLPGEDGRHDEWNRSALEAVDYAQKSWVRLASNMNLGAYELSEALGDLPNPEWPEMEFEKLLSIAFKDHFIHSLDHPAVRRLRGEM